MRVLDVVMMGHEEMWACMQEKDAIYANPEATEDDYMHAAELEGKFAEYDGYTAEARAGELLLGVGIPIEQHDGPMSDVAPGWKLRVLLVQALFANPDILLLDEPTNNLDINTIRWLEDVLNERDSHDGDHLARPPLPQPGVHPHGRPGLRHDHASTRATTTTTWKRSTHGARAADEGQRQGQGQDRRPAGVRAPLLGQQVQGPAGHQPHEADREAQAGGRQAVVSRQYPWIRFDVDEKEKLHRQAVEIEDLIFAYEGMRSSR